MLNNKIIFMGAPQISAIYLQSLIDNNHNIIAAYTQPPKKKGRGLKTESTPVHKIALLNKIDIFTPSDFINDQCKNNLKNFNPDLIIVMAYGLKLPQYVLDLPRFGCINIHVSLLPRWRGASPIEHSLLNGDKETGISIFRLTSEMDAGPLIINEKIKIDEHINKDELTEKLNNVGVKLLNLTLPRIFKKEIVYKNQGQQKITYASKISTEMRKLDFNESAETINNKIRAFATKPSAWFFYKNERIKIIEAKFIKGNWESSKIINDQFHIGCKDGKICPGIIQREGKKPLKLEDFLRGFTFEINSKINA